jgi:hypothetical protein
LQGSCVAGERPDVLGEGFAVASCRRSEQDAGDAPVVLVVVRPIRGSPSDQRRGGGLQERLEEALGAFGDAATTAGGVR